MWILFGFECGLEGIAFKAGTLKTEQQTFYKKAKEDEEIKEKEGRNHLVAN